MVLMVFVVLADIPSPVAVVMMNGIFFFTIVYTFYALRHRRKREKRNQNSQTSSTNNACMEPNLGSSRADGEGGSPIAGEGTVSADSPENTGKPIQQEVQPTAIILAIVALLLQVSGIAIVFGFEPSLKLWAWKRYWCIPTALLCLSLAWSPFFQEGQIFSTKLNISSNKCSNTSDSQENKQKVHSTEQCDNKDKQRENVRWKSSIITNILKLFLVPCISLLIAHIFANVNIEYVKYGILELRDFTTKIRTELYINFVANITSSLIGYTFSLLACKMNMQELSFAFPLALATPLAYLLTFFNCNPFSGFTTCSVPEKVDTSDIWRNVGIFVLLYLSAMSSTIVFAFRSKISALEKEESVSEREKNIPKFLSS